MTRAVSLTLTPLIAASGPLPAGSIGARGSTAARRSLKDRAVWQHIRVYEIVD